MRFPRPALSLSTLKMDAEAIAKASLAIAGDLCIYTNQNVTCEVIGKAQ